MGWTLSQQDLRPFTYITVQYITLPIFFNLFLIIEFSTGFSTISSASVENYTISTLDPWPNLLEIYVDQSVL